MCPVLATTSPFADCRIRRYHKPWEAFEVGFLYGYNVDHELAVWTRIALVFGEFLKRHPSVNKRNTSEISHLQLSSQAACLWRRRVVDRVAAQHVDELRPLDVRGTVDPHQAATGADELQQVPPPLGIGEPTLAHQVAGGDTVIQMP
jgi:hypothetical protein